MIDKATVDKIFDATNIVDVVSDFVSLKKRGSSYLGLLTVQLPAVYLCLSQSQGVDPCPHLFHWRRIPAVFY